MKDTLKQQWTKLRDWTRHYGLLDSMARGIERFFGAPTKAEHDASGGSNTQSTGAGDPSARAQSNQPQSGAATA